VRTLVLVVEYDGTDYAGFGVQPGQRTIQGEMERALADTLGHQPRVTPGGRTDTGVHARGQVVSFRTTSRLGCPDLVRALNARLPEDIQVRSAAEAPSGFDARRSARSRWYRYVVWNHPQRNLWWRRYSYHVRSALDLAAMQLASRALMGERDFAALGTHLSENGEGRSTVRTVYRSEWRRIGPFLCFDIEANGFLRHMVRTAVGTMLEIGRGRWPPEAMDRILERRDRRLAGPTAPPSGLTLMAVRYPEGAVELAVEAVERAWDTPPFEPAPEV